MLSVNTALRHQRLHPVNIQRARRQVVDMAAGEADHIGNQPVLVMQRMVGLLIDRGMAVPAEGSSASCTNSRASAGEMPSASYCAISARQRG
jgi:hypothetical protein